MRLIDADEFEVFGYDLSVANNLNSKEEAYCQGVELVLDKIDASSTIDAVEVVRCKDCKYRLDRLYCRISPNNPVIVTNVDFCSRGERNEPFN